MVTIANNTRRRRKEKKKKSRERKPFPNTFLLNRVNSKHARQHVWLSFDSEKIHETTTTATEHFKYHPIFTLQIISLSYDDFTRDGAKLNRI